MAWAQLVRAPNLFTAVADPFAGWLIAGASGETWILPAVMASSALLYAAGMLLNDCFDYHDDCRERPKRPLPRGAIHLQSAWVCGWTLLVAGLGVAALAGGDRLAVALALSLLIVAYNAWAKKSALLGPLVMGGCRCLNFMLGMGVMTGGTWIAPVVLAGYVVVLTIIARSESVNAGRRRVVTLLLQGIVVVDAVLVVAFTWPTPDGVGAMLVASLILPVLALSRTLEMT
jgi:4-hydroxybenzoate polyprenyltransferase